jgi:signal transduction histidine kinase
MPFKLSVVSREAALLKALTATDRLGDLLPVLHRHAVSAVDGRVSILFQFNRRRDALQATSASGLDRMPPDVRAHDLPPDLFQEETAKFFAAASEPIKGFDALGTKGTVIVPLTCVRELVGVLVVGCDAGASHEQLAEAAAVGRAFGLALERARATGEADLQNQSKELLQVFSRDISHTALPAGLESLCTGANRIFGAGRTSVWLHDRRARMLVLSASSDAAYRAQDRRIPLADSQAPPANALRQERAELIPSGASAAGSQLAMITIPLRGNRRALGSLVMEHVRIEPGAQIAMLQRADEFGRQLSTVLENVLLLDTVLRLSRSEKLAALGQFVAGIAHELNNPLQGVLGHLELLRTTGAFPKALRRDMQLVYREADRAAKIVRNLLVFAGSRRLVRRRTSINATVSRVLALRAPALRAAGIEVVRRHQEGLPRVKADPLLIQQAMLNIVLNAEQAIGTGGRIESHTSVVEHRGTRHVVVRIRDTGPGIQPSAMARLFEPFYTTKEVGKGTGLGLAITYGIIQEHGGEITASNHPEGGAVFTVQLPVESE